MSTSSVLGPLQSRYRLLTDEQWARIAVMLPGNEGKNGRRCWRGSATRYDKWAIVYRSAAVLAALSYG